VLGHRGLFRACSGKILIAFIAVAQRIEILSGSDSGCLQFFKDFISGIPVAVKYHREIGIVGFDTLLRLAQADSRHIGKMLAVAGHDLAAFPDLARAAVSFLAAHADAVSADYPALVRWCISVPFYGFDMLPKDGAGAPKECWFDGAFMGSVLAPAAKILATPYEMILWDTPLCVVWHALAQQAAAFGVKGVERPPDTAVLRRMMREAAEREGHGLLHPWQYADPVSYGLTAEQFRRNPNLAALFARMAADFERGGRKPLDPADYPLPDPPEPVQDFDADPSDTPPQDTITMPGACVGGLVLSVTSSASAAERTSAVEEQSHGI
jgi:hypothetical protein